MNNECCKITEKYYLQLGNPKIDPNITMMQMYLSKKNLHKLCSNCQAQQQEVEEIYDFPK